MYRDFGVNPVNLTKPNLGNAMRYRKCDSVVVFISEAARQFTRPTCCLANFRCSRLKV